MGYVHVAVVLFRHSLDVSQSVAVIAAGLARQGQAGFSVAARVSYLAIEGVLDIEQKRSPGLFHVQPYPPFPVARRGFQGVVQQVAENHGQVGCLDAGVRGDKQVQIRRYAKPFRVPKFVVDDAVNGDVAGVAARLGIACAVEQSVQVTGDLVRVDFGGQPPQRRPMAFYVVPDRPGPLLRFLHGADLGKVIVLFPLVQGGFQVARVRRREPVVQIKDEDVYPEYDTKPWRLPVRPWRT